MTPQDNNSPPPATAVPPETPAVPPVTQPQTAVSQPIPPAQPVPTDASQARQSLQQLAQAVPSAPQFDPSKQPPPAYDNIYTEICTEIIKAQSKIMGMDLALEQAQGIQGLAVDAQTLHSTVAGDGSKVINDLIQRYKNFFGSAAVEVCREASARLLSRLPPERTPLLLHPAQI